MKPELWFVAPVSAIALGGIATLIQPQQPLATLLGSGIGALASAPLIEKNQRRTDRYLTGLEQQLRQAIPEALDPIHQEISRSLHLLRENLSNSSVNTLSTPQFELLLESIHAQSAALQTIETLLQKPQPPARTLKTAVLYDIENLVFNQGQRLDPARVNQLVSLDNILESIKGTVDLGEIAIKRAYGNWQNQILQALNDQLEQSQIERIGVYGRNHNQRNAADIQLALDAIDLIYQYPDITTFVLISGDGGFGSIALRLRDYGKTVIGCAYRNAASDSFQRVCHQFVFLDNPFMDSAPARNGKNGSPTPSQSNPSNRTHPTNHAAPSSPSLSPRLPVEPLNYDQIPLAAIRQRETEKLLELLAYYTSDSEKRQELTKGILFDAVFLDIKSLIPQLEPLRFGFFKPSEWVAYLTDQHHLSICLAVNSQLRKAVLCWRDHLPEHCTARTHEPQNIHTISIYRAIFAHEVAGDPLLTEVGHWLIAHRPHNLASQRMINTLFEQLRNPEQPISQSGIKRAIANYIKAGILTRTVHPSGDTLTLNPAIKDFTSLAIALQTRFRQVVEERLTKIGETINEHVFAQAVPLKPLQQPPKRTENPPESQS